MLDNTHPASDEGKFPLVQVQDLRQKVLYLVVAYSLVAESDKQSRSKKYFESRAIVIPKENYDYSRDLTVLRNAKQRLDNIRADTSLHVAYEEISNEFFAGHAHWDRLVNLTHMADILGYDDYASQKTGKRDRMYKAAIEKLLVGKICKPDDCRGRGGCADTISRRLEYACVDARPRWTGINERALCRIARLWGFCPKSWTDPDERDFSVHEWDEWPPGERQACRTVWMAFAGPSESEMIRGADFRTFQDAYDRLLKQDDSVPLRTNPDGMDGMVRRVVRPPSSSGTPDAGNGPRRIHLQALPDRRNVDGFGLSLEYEQKWALLNLRAAPEMEGEDGTPVQLMVLRAKVVVNPTDGLDKYLALRRSGPAESPPGETKVRVSVDDATIPYGFVIESIGENAALPRIFLPVEERLAILEVEDQAPTGAKLEVSIQVRRCDVRFPPVDQNAASAVIQKRQFLRLLRSMLNESAPKLRADQRSNVFRQTYQITRK